MKTRLVHRFTVLILLPGLFIDPAVAQAFTNETSFIYPNSETHSLRLLEDAIPPCDLESPPLNKEGIWPKYEMAHEPPLPSSSQLIEMDIQRRKILNKHLKDLPPFLPENTPERVVNLILQINRSLPEDEAFAEIEMGLYALKPKIKRPLFGKDPDTHIAELMDHLRNALDQEIAGRAPQVKDDTQGRQIRESVFRLLKQAFGERFDGTVLRLSSRWAVTITGVDRRVDGDYVIGKFTVGKAETLWQYRVDRLIQEEAKNLPEFDLATSEVGASSELDQQAQEALDNAIQIVQQSGSTDLFLDILSTRANISLRTLRRFQERETLLDVEKNKVLLQELALILPEIFQRLARLGFARAMPQVAAYLVSPEEFLQEVGQTAGIDAEILRQFLDQDGALTDEQAKQLVPVIDERLQAIANGQAQKSLIKTLEEADEAGIPRAYFLSRLTSHLKIATDAPAQFLNGKFVLTPLKARRLIQDAGPILDKTVAQVTRQVLLNAIDEAMTHDVPSEDFLRALAEQLQAKEEDLENVLNWRSTFTHAQSRALRAALSPVSKSEEPAPPEINLSPEVEAAPPEVNLSLEVESASPEAESSTEPQLESAPPDLSQVLVGVLQALREELLGVPASQDLSMTRMAKRLRIPKNTLARWYKKGRLREFKITVHKNEIRFQAADEEALRNLISPDESLLSQYYSITELTQPELLGIKRFTILKAIRQGKVTPDLQRPEGEGFTSYFKRNRLSELRGLFSPGIRNKDFAEQSNRSRAWVSRAAREGKITSMAAVGTSKSRFSSDEADQMRLPDVSRLISGSELAKREGHDPSWAGDQRRSGKIKPVLEIRRGGRTDYYYNPDDPSDPTDPRPHSSTPLKGSEAPANPASPGRSSHELREAA